MVGDPLELVAGRRGVVAAVVRQGDLERRTTSAPSRNGSATATTRSQAAHISARSGVEAGAPFATASSAGSIVRPWPRIAQTRRSCQARWPTIHEIEFIGPSRCSASSADTPTSPRWNSERANRSWSTRGWGMGEG